MFAHRLDADAGEDVARERLRQHPPRSAVADAAAAQVENGVLIEPADGGAMGALDVIGIDFQLRLGIHRCLFGEQEVLVGLLGVGLLGGLEHVDAAVEDPLGTAVEDPVVIFVAQTPRLGVLHHHVVVGQLVAMGKVKPIEDTLGPFAGQLDPDVVAREPRSGGQGMRAQVRAPRQARVASSPPDGAERTPRSRPEPAPAALWVDAASAVANVADTAATGSGPRSDAIRETVSLVKRIVASTHGEGDEPSQHPIRVAIGGAPRCIGSAACVSLPVFVTVSLSPPTSRTAPSQPLWGCLLPWNAPHPPTPKARSKTVSPPYPHAHPAHLRRQHTHADDGVRRHRQQIPIASASPAHAVSAPATTRHPPHTPAQPAPASGAVASRPPGPRPVSS